MDCQGRCFCTIGKRTIRKTLIILIIGSLALAQSAYAYDAPDSPPSVSLFLTEDEQTRLAATTPLTTPEDPADVRLDAIAYYAPDRWTLWVRGEEWTPTTRRAYLKILHVKSDTVTLSYRADAGSGFHTLTLHPRQTYRAATGQVEP